MKLNRRQKQILKHINNGSIYDLFSYITYYELDEFIKFNKQEIQNLFDHDDICKEYYYPYVLTPNTTNVLSSDNFSQKCENNEIDPNKYNRFCLSLGFKEGIKHITIDGKQYTVNFYDGVHIAKSFDSIIDFLSLWQYLKSEMLILEVPIEISEETLGLFFEKNEAPTNNSLLSASDILQNIDYSNFTYSDKYYITPNMCSFSNEHYAICKDFLSKRIYPTPQLNLYVQNNFTTTEESIQRSALIAAWIAIFVTILLTFVPYIFSHFDAGGSENSQKDSSVVSTEIMRFDNTVYFSEYYAINY